MSLYPFPINVYRVFGEDNIEIIKRDEHGKVATVCVTAHTSGDRAIALMLLKESPGSFVLCDGMRFWPDGTVQRCDPACPASITELCQAFEVEIVGREWPGPRSRIYIFTHTPQGWEYAQQAISHLLNQGLISSRSYIEGDHTGEPQGLSAQNLDAKPHGASLVTLLREAAICEQNEIDMCDGEDEFLERVISKAIQEGRYEENDEDEWREKTEQLEDEIDQWWTEEQEAEEEASQEGDEYWHEERENEQLLTMNSPLKRFFAHLTRAVTFLYSGR